ncbi:transcriptional regulator [Clostridium acetobutylicum]|nr:transcriptional regulator [Clostridium acetobutylicum]
MDISEMFWTSSVDDIKRGYVYDKKKELYICLICGKTYENGVIYKRAENLYDAKKYMQIHIKNDHKSVFDYLINMSKAYTGITDMQKQFLMLYESGLSDKEIAEKMMTSNSTVRNYRFKLKEKEKQAKVFMAIMDIMEENRNKGDEDKLVGVHKSVTMSDDRFSITEEEERNIIKNCFDKNNHLKDFPAKEKKKIIVLKHILKNFKNEEQYTEKQVNLIIKRIYDDYATIRRALIEYGFMDRRDDCSAYWVKN